MTATGSWFDAIVGHAGRDGARIAVSDGDRSWSYAEVVRRANALAAWLWDLGLRPGDRLGIHVQKGVEEVLAILAATRLGAVFVDVHPQVTVTQLAHVVRDAGIRILVTSARRGGEALADPYLLGQLEKLVVVGQGGTDQTTRWPDLTGEVPFPHPSPNLDQLATLIYTSGSTGKPKGVMHSQRNLLAFAANVATYLKASAEDRVLGLLPLSFSLGLNQLLTTLLVGGELILQKAPFPAEVVRTLVRRRITGLAGVPTVWSQLLDYLDQEPTDLGSLRYVTNAGGRLPERTGLRLRAHLPRAEIIPMYGSTEALRTTYLPPELFASKPGAMGKPIPNVEVLVVHPEGGLCGAGQEGELVHRGAHVSQGYWNNAEESARRFRSCPSLGEAHADEKVFYSGDIVRADADGIFWFVSRAGWMVKSGGFRFSIEEVEELLMQSGLLRAVAVLSFDDEAMGQVIEAVVCPKSAPDAPGALETSALERYCWKAMPSYMIPRAFHPWGPLPLLPNGKLDRTLLRFQVERLDSRR